MDLKYAHVKVGDESLLNHTKIKKEDAFEIIKENSLKIISESSMVEFGDKCSFPANFDVVKNLLLHENVYATPTIDFNQFKGNKLIGTYSVSTMRSNEQSGLVKDVTKFLSRGFEIYIHSYYIMNVDRYIDDELTLSEPWFWYRIGFKQK
jgi:hypothetical protein